MGKTIQVFGFPYLISAEAVIQLLEKYTGNGSIYALEVKQSKGGRRAYARVQFRDNRSAEIIISIASGRRLYYGSSYLKAWEMDLDMVPRPRTFVHQMERLVLNFGCQVSSNKFAVLWKNANISVKFGIGLKKIYFFLSVAHVDYKLELLNENVWQIVLHCPPGQSAKFLLIQVSLLKFEQFVIHIFHICKLVFE